MNYGPVPALDIQFPFDGDVPKPVVFVGENGSGKSIVLSHIVNGLMAAKNGAFPETPEVESGKVYKLRSNAYIRSGAAYYLARVEFDDDMFVEEVRAVGNREVHADLPNEHWSTELQDLWRKLPAEQSDHYGSSFPADSSLIADEPSRNKVRRMFSEHCILYFPPNRFEEPAWLTEANLSAGVEHMELNQLSGHTSRKNNRLFSPAR